MNCERCGRAFVFNNRPSMTEANIDESVTYETTRVAPIMGAQVDLGGDNIVWELDYESETITDGDIFNVSYHCSYCGSEIDRDSVTKIFREVSANEKSEV